MDARWDYLIAAYEQGLANAVAAFEAQLHQSQEIAVAAWRAAGPDDEMGLG